MQLQTSWKPPMHPGPRTHARHTPCLGLLMHPQAAVRAQEAVRVDLVDARQGRDDQRARHAAAVRCQLQGLGAGAGKPPVEDLKVGGAREPDLAGAGEEGLQCRGARWGGGS